MQVNHDQKNKRFVVELEGETAFIEYSASDGMIEFFHTEVPAAHEGKGVASAMAKEAFEHAKREKLRVIATCSFVEGWVNKHPEYQDIVEE